jgi:hypothetical protein
VAVLDQRPVRETLGESRAAPVAVIALGAHVSEHVGVRWRSLEPASMWAVAKPASAAARRIATRRPEWVRV